MRKLHLSFAALTAVLLVAACGSRPAGRGATILGTVERAASGGSAAASDIRVRIDGTSLSATTDADGRFEITEVPSGTIVIHFQGDGLEARLELSGVAAGTVIKIKVKIEDGRAVLVKIEIEVEDDLEDVEGLEFEGRVESITPPTLVVGGRTVVTDANTRMERDGGAFTLADLVVGMIVEIHGMQLPDGTILAQRVEIEDH